MRFLLLLFISFPILADQIGPCVDCDENTLARFAEGINWSAASKSQIRNAACTRKDLFTENEMTQWIGHQSGTQAENKSINGINFEGESTENLKAFEHLTTAVDFFGREKPAAEQPTYASSCKKVDCAVKEIFGETGTQLLFMLRKFGFNGSHIAHSDDADAWKKSELDQVLLALTDFPSSVLPMKDNKKLIHFKRGYQRSGGGSTIANAVIEIFDLWDNDSKEEKRYTLTHEIGHYIAGESNVDDSDYWKSLSGWDSETRIVNGEEVEEFEFSKPSTIVSRYGKSNPAEDFAESASAYRYNPELLKRKSPEKYELIKNVIFNGVEYTSEHSCNNPKLLTNEIIANAENLYRNWQPSPQELDKITKICTIAAIRNFSEESRLDTKSYKMNQCYESALDAYSKEFLVKSLQAHPHIEFLSPLLKNAPKLKLPESIHQAHMTKVQASMKSFLPRWIEKGVTSQFLMTPKCEADDLKFAYQDFEEYPELNTFSMKEQIAKVTQIVCKNAVENRNFVNGLNIVNVRDEEIKSAINRLLD